MSESNEAHELSVIVHPPDAADRGASHQTFLQAVSLSAFNRLEIDVNCSVVGDVDQQIFPGVKEGMIVQAVNGALVTDRAELRCELEAVAERGGGKDVVVQLTWAKPGDQPAGESRPTGSRRTSDHGHSAEEDFEICSNPDDTGSTGPSIKPAEEAASSTTLRPNTKNPEEIMFDAAERVAPGRCIVVLAQGANPAVYVEAAAAVKGTSVMCISGSRRIKTRVPREEFYSILVRSIERGLWVLIEEASKSISTLDVLANAIEDSHRSGKVHKDSRVFLVCEPHPHFPPSLLAHSVTLRFRQSTETLEETMHQSASRIDVLTGRKQTNGVTMNLPAVASRRVKMAAEVEIVELEQSAAQQGEVPAEAIEETPVAGMRRFARYGSVGGGDKMICLSHLGENRLAVGSSCGHVTLLDLAGLPLLQFRPLKSCIWDMKFASNNDFTTASEDGTAAIMRYEIRSKEITTLCSASFETDVFAVTYVDPTNPNSAVVSGGLATTICVMQSDRTHATRCTVPTSIQAMTSVGATSVICGGGNGLIAMLDPNVPTIVRQSMKHEKKVPAVATFDNVLATGSFDKSVRLWDARGLRSTHALMVPDVVTAVSVDGNHLTACSGSTLFVWDVRNLQNLLASRSQAWTGLTRGLQLFSKTRTVVTASVDGVARFWEFN